MASKRVENKKLLQTAQVYTHVDDQEKSIGNLIQAGLENAKQGGGHYQRNKTGKLPANISIRPTKSRGSSVGHSPQGSSDDGFGSSGRQTLSPTSISANTINGFHPYNPPNSSVSHFRQGSAPALINYGPMEHQQASSSRCMVPGLPIAHGHSRSLNTVASPPEIHGNLTGSAYNIAPPMQSPELEAPMQPYHGHSKSLDVEAVNHNNLVIKQEAFDMMHAGYSQPNQMHHGYYPNDKMQQGAYSHAKSHSLDPMTISQMHTTSPQNMGMTSPIACSSDDLDDGLGSLPKGWSKSYDPQVNRAYFINHNTKTTTWNDPRIPKEMQENLKDRAMMSQPQQQQHQYYLQHQQQQLPQHQNYQPEYPQSSVVNQLKMERNSMLERQQQLLREGLLLPPQQAAMYGNQQPQMPPQTSYQGGYEMHQGRQYQQSDAMEVDFNNQSIQHNPIDPAFVQDLNPADLNPHEFDKYLYIDRKPQQHVQAARYN